VNYEDEALITAPSDEALQDPISPAQDEENKVSHFPFQFFDDTLFYDSEGEEVKQLLEELVPSFSDKDEEKSLGDGVLDPLPSDKVIQAIDAPAQQEVNTVSYFPFQDFDDALFYDLEREEVLEEPLDALNPSCYDKGSDIVDNIDEFIHVGRRKWDVIGSNEDPIYDIDVYCLGIVSAIYIKEVFARFSPPLGFPRINAVYLVIVFLLVILPMLLLSSKLRRNLIIAQNLTWFQS
jgi:hypothetical protein